LEKWEEDTQKYSNQCLGFITTSTVFLIVFFAKFTHGAWILVLHHPHRSADDRIKRHYLNLERMMALRVLPRKQCPENGHNPDSKLNRAILQAVYFAKSCTQAG